MPLLEARDAYQAGLNDHAAALRRARHAVKEGIVPAEDQNKFYIRELEHLWQKRIDIGELPPILEAKAS